MILPGGRGHIRSGVRAKGRKLRAATRPATWRSRAAAAVNGRESAGTMIMERSPKINPARRARPTQLRSLNLASSADMLFRTAVARADGSERWEGALWPILVALPNCRTVTGP